MKPVLFLDSGIGGIPYCRYFHERNQGESIVYLADRLHFHYGKWEKHQLSAILMSLIEQVTRVVAPKIVVLACNTATLAGLSQLRERFPSIPFVGTVPAVKPATLASKSGKIGVLGTELTIKEPFIRDMSAQYGKGEVMGIAAPELVEFIENRLDSAAPEEKKEMVRIYLDQFRAAGVDSLVLGCTHFLYLQEEFQQEAAPDITVFESVKGIDQRIESLLAAIPPEEHNPNMQNRLLLTGTSAPEPSWIKLADSLGFELSLLEDL